MVFKACSTWKHSGVGGFSHWRVGSATCREWGNAYGENSHGNLASVKCLRDMPLATARSSACSVTVSLCLFPSFFCCFKHLEDVVFEDVPLNIVQISPHVVGKGVVLPLGVCLRKPVLGRDALRTVCPRARACVCGGGGGAVWHCCWKCTFQQVDLLLWEALCFGRLQAHATFVGLI